MTQSREAVVMASDPFELARAEVMLRGYDARWNAEPLEVLGVEVEFRMPLINPATGASSRTFTLGGKIDLIAGDPAGRVFIVEHKTASGDVSPGSDYMKRLRMDAQISVYMDAARALGHAVEGCLYDVLSKPGERPSQVPLVDADGTKIVLDAAGVRVRTKDGKKWRETGSAADGYVLQTRLETPDEYRARLIAVVAADPNGYYTRAEVVRLDNELDEARYDVWQSAVQMRDGMTANRHPRNPDACVRYGRTCEYFDACTGVASLDDETRFRRVENVHVELTDAGAAVLSASRLHAARACARLHRLRYLDGYRPAVEPDALRFGALIHRGLEAWWRATGDKRLPAALAAIGASTNEAVPKEEERHVATAASIAG